MESSQLKNIVEAALLASAGPLTVGQLQALFGDDSAPEKQDIRAVLKELQVECEGRGIEICEVASGFRIQVRDEMSPWLSKLWEERPPRYSRALMETLAIIAYRQPVTRGDIEEIRGVSVTSNIIRTLLEREWIKVVGHRDVPGKPAMFGTTRDFLDYFSLKKLDDLPPLAELAQLEPMGVQLDLDPSDEGTPPTAEDAAAVAESGEAADAGNSEDASENTGEVVAESADGDPAEAAAEETADAETESDGNSDTENEFIAASADFEEDDDEPVTDDEIEAAAARIAAITAELSGESAEDEAEDEADAAQDVPPGAVAPLVGLNAPGEEPPEPATVTSIDDARAAASEASGDEATEVDGESDQSAEVVPLKTP